MDLGIHGRVAVVGGSSRGIGRACAEALLAEGAQVALCGRGKEDLASARIALEPMGKVIGVQADLSTADGVEHVVGVAREQLGPIEILVVNAGGPPAGQPEDFDDDGWLQAVELTLMSAVRLCRVAAPDMKAGRWGRVVMLTSISVKQVLDNMVLSNTLRAGVTALGKTLSRRWASDGMTVNTVCPGYTLTGRVTSLARSLARTRNVDEAEVVEEWKRQIPAGRLADPAEIGALVAFLASDKAAYINGAVISADGGWTSCLS